MDIDCQKINKKSICWLNESTEFIVQINKAVTQIICIFSLTNVVVQKIKKKKINSWELFGKYK